jgi:cytochrome c-type biogenesis protein CcmE
MDSRRLKFVLLGSGVALSMVLLIWAGMDRPGGFAYYLTVTEFLEQGGRADGDFRINGKVVEGSIERAASGQDVRFVMSDGTSSLAVNYHGIIPDTFVDRADVVVQGSLETDDTLNAHELLAKCPSKYEAADGYEPADERDQS